MENGLIFFFGKKSAKLYIENLQKAMTPLLLVGVPYLQVGEGAQTSSTFPRPTGIYVIIQTVSVLMFLCCKNLLSGSFIVNI